MNGQYAVKGYLYQSLAALLGSFSESNWVSVCVEPSDESEKVDIIWTYENEETKVIQVKSSKNLFTFGNAKKWSTELKEKSPNASSYELLLIGKAANRILNIENQEIDGVKVVVRDQSIKDYERIVISHISEFLDNHGFDVPYNFCKCIAEASNHNFMANSTIGKTVSRKEFENLILCSLKGLWDKLLRSPYAYLLQTDSSNEDSSEKIIMNHLLGLFGWDKFNEGEEVGVMNEKLGKRESHVIDYWGTAPSPLKDNIKDMIYVNLQLDSTYAQHSARVIHEKLNSSKFVRAKLGKSGRISDNASEHYIHFALSIFDDDSIDISKLKYKKSSLEDNVTYSIVCNKQMNFVVSSIITAQAYRANLQTKFLYPITENNSQIDKIGKRDCYMPPEYINSSVIPIVKEDRDTISVLLFCSDCYSPINLKKLIWLLIRLTSGMANEYCLYFSDFEKNNENEANEVIRSFDNQEITRRITINKLPLFKTSELMQVPVPAKAVLKDVSVEGASIRNQIKVSPFLIDFLPYGDTLKPFLASDAINSENLKLFLEYKGIYYRTASKTKLIQYMTSLLFSSSDIEQLVQYVSIKTKTPNNTSVEYPVTEAYSDNPILNTEMVDLDEVAKDLNVRIVKVTRTLKDKEHTLTLDLEQDQPNNLALVSVSHSYVTVGMKYDENINRVIMSKEYNSKVGNKLGNQAISQIAKNYIQNALWEDKAIDVKFSDFSNKERINFLLSFTNLEESRIFINFDVIELKYMFDEENELPEEYRDREGKECIIKFKGKNLATIKELQEEQLKGIILGEEITIHYKYKLNKIAGEYRVTINFSDALHNAPHPDGLLNFKGKTTLSKIQKGKIPNIAKFEAELKKSFSEFYRNKLQQFNKI